MIKLRELSLILIKDEQGGGTIMGLLWFMLLVGICGLAVDSTDGFRTKTGLQATADAVSLAAVMDLPNDPSAALANAMVYADLNMPSERNGHVLDPADIEFGVWDPVTRTFNAGETPAMAARVLVARSSRNSNPLPANFLRIVGLTDWDVAALAVAERFIPECLRDGLLAEGIVDISSNNGFVNEICIHGEQGVDMQNHNFFESGVTVSMPDIATMLSTPGGDLTGNPGLQPALKNQSRQMRMINDLPNIIAKLRDPSLDTDFPAVIPSYIDANQPVIAADNKIDFTGLNFAEGSGRIYDIDCKGEPTINIPGGIVLRNVVIVIECNLNVNPGATLTNVVLASYNVGNGQDPASQTNISIQANVQLGLPDNCTPGGGVQIFSLASVHFSSGASIDGLQIVATGDIDLGARDNGVNGISAQAGGDISLTANNEFGLCSGGAPNLFTVGYYHLVK